MSENKESIGISVSEFYNCYISLDYYHWKTTSDDNDTKIISDESIESEIISNNFEVSDVSSDVIHVTYEKINDVANFITNKVLALNSQLSKKVKEKIGEELFKTNYAPVGRIIFTDTESLNSVESDGKLKKQFSARFYLYKTIDKNIQSSPTINVDELQKMLRQTIIRDLLDVVEELKEEETFIPPSSFLKKFESIGIKS